MGGRSGAQISVPGDVLGRELVAAISISTAIRPSSSATRPPDQLGWASPVYVADTDERAKKEARAGIESLFNDYLAVPFQMLLPPGYTSLPSMKNTMRMRKQLGAQKRHSLEELMESGTVVVGSPKTVRDELSALRDKTGANKLVTMLQFGVLPDDLAKRNMELFASEVMPHLKD